MSQVLHLTDDNFENETASGLVLVDFWASWCGPCKMLSPILDAVAAEADEGVKIVKVNAEECPRTAQRFSVRNLPTLIILRDGEIVRQLGSVMDKAALLRELGNA